MEDSKTATATLELPPDAALVPKMGPRPKPGERGGKFRLLIGTHNEVEHTDEVYKNNRGQWVRRVRRHNFTRGQIVTSEFDLASRFNRRNCKKFVRINAPDDPGPDDFQGMDPPAGDPKPNINASNTTNPTTETVFDGVDYGAMNVDKLRRVAEAESIDLGGATKKADIIRVIIETLKAEAEETEEE